MQGQKGASLQSTRRIYRRTAKKLAAERAHLAAVQARPDDRFKASSVAHALEMIHMSEEWLSGRSVPVGVLSGLWREVCAAEAAKAAAAIPVGAS